MKINTLLYSLGLKKTPDYSYSFAANNPFTGMFFHVRFSDGRSGLVCDRHNGTYVPQVKLLPRDSDGIRLFRCCREGSLSRADREREPLRQEK